MKYSILVVFVSMVAVPTALAGDTFTTFTVASESTVALGTVGGTAAGALSFGSYNWATDHMIWSDYCNSNRIG